MELEVLEAEKASLLDDKGQGLARVREEAAAASEGRMEEEVEVVLRRKDAVVVEVREGVKMAEGRKEEGLEQLREKAVRLRNESEEEVVVLQKKAEAESLWSKVELGRLHTEKASLLDDKRQGLA